MNKRTLSQALFHILLFMCIAFALYEVVHIFADMFTVTQTSVAYFIAGFAYGKIVRRLQTILELSYVPRG